MSHLVQEVELRDVGCLCVQQLIGDVEDLLLDRQLDRQKVSVTHLPGAQNTTDGSSSGMRTVSHMTQVLLD